MASQDLDGFWGGEDSLKRTLGVFLAAPQWAWLTEGRRLEVGFT